MISILTPTWNRGPYLRRVWKSLDAQRSKDFEWIVGNDGSEDDTEAIIRELADRSAFPVLYLRASAHVGKARMDNEAVRRARGEFVLWCDSDDVLTPDAVERLSRVWASIDPADRPDFVGVTALVATDAGVVVNPFPDREFVDVSWNDLAQVHQVQTDMLYMARTEALRANPFPEVDLIVPESSVWSVIGHQKTRFVAEVLRKVEYGAPNAVSFTREMSYNRGRAIAMAISHRECRAYLKSWKAEMLALLKFLRWCRHGEIGIAEARALWSDRRMWAFWPAALLAQIVAFRDRLSRKVVRTHRTFLLNRGAEVRATWLSTKGHE